MSRYGLCEILIGLSVVVSATLAINAAWMAYSVLDGYLTGRFAPM